MSAAPTACALIIGNEILSGRTQDVNLNWLARELNAIGVRLKEARVISDGEEAIIGAVNHCRACYDYVFTTGGIGPTHDDITAAAVARALSLPLQRNAEAERLLRAHYGDQINAARLRMADVPEGASLIPNPVSAAPGFVIENVYVLAGVPVIMQAMFAAIRHTLQGGAKMLSRTLVTWATEGTFAEALGAIQQRHPSVEIGSYPFIRAGKLGASVVLRGAEAQALAQACDAVKALLTQTGGGVTEESAA